MANDYIAIDIGDSPGRHIPGHVQNGRLELQEACRFDDRQVRRNGYGCRDMDNLWSGILFPSLKPGNNIFDLNRFARRRLRRPHREDG